MNEGKNNGRGIFYGVIGVATLVVAIIGATFAYFTATASNETTITGNMATVKLDLAVEKVTTAGDTSGIIPMSNTMVETAVNKHEGREICIDDNGNAVCQIYKITLSNSSSAGVFVDGYVALIKGSGTPTDYEAKNGNATTMRWAQVFQNAAKDGYTTGTANIDLGQTETIGYTMLDANTETDSTGKNEKNIRDKWTTFKTGETTIGGSDFTVDANKGVLAKATISGNEYPVIGTNYIRVSDHKFATADSLSAEEKYTQAADVTSALVYNQQVQGAASGTPTKKEYYIVVWLSETGTNQTAGGTGTGVATEANNFFSGQVKFLSAQGSEVSATFSGYSRVAPTDTAGSTTPGSES